MAMAGRTARRLPTHRSGPAPLPRAALPALPSPQERQRGRPGPGARPDPSVAPSVAALASRSAARQARVDPHQWFILATHERDEGQWPARAGLAGAKGQAAAARGCRGLQAPQFLAAARARKTPARLLALVRVMTVCWLVSAACESRLRRPLPEPNATG